MTKTSKKAAAHEILLIRVSILSVDSLDAIHLIKCLTHSHIEIIWIRFLRFHLIELFLELIYVLLVDTIPV